MIVPILLITAIGLIFGVILSIAADKFKVKVDKKLEKIIELLPGANCGACGYVGCEAYAEAISKNPDLFGSCRVMSNEGAGEIAEILGVSAKESIPQVAQVRCGGGCKDKYEYKGIETCNAASQVVNGFKMCDYGCLGFGDCVEKCPFNAMFINERGVAEVDERRCTGCGTCVSVCPRNLITLVKRTCKVFVQCNSKDKGGFVRKNCETGCIGCKRCEKACDAHGAHAITIVDNLAIIDPDKCDNCYDCVSVCPQKTIVRINQPEAKIEEVVA